MNKPKRLHDRFLRIEEGPADARERHAAHETKTCDIHNWLAPRSGRPTLPERMVKVETRQAGMIWTLCAVTMAVISASVAWLVSKIGSPGYWE